MLKEFGIYTTTGNTVQVVLSKNNNIIEGFLVPIIKLKSLTNRQVNGWLKFHYFGFDKEDVFKVDLKEPNFCRDWGYLGQVNLDLQKGLKKKMNEIIIYSNLTFHLK